MIVFTDREVPLGELGTLSKGSAKAEGAEARAADEEGKAKDQSRVDLALIYCYGETVAVSRKIDPDLPIYLEKQEIYAERELRYNRLTGDFRVFGPGQVYKWDRSDDSNKSKDGADQEEDSVAQGDRVDGQQPQRGGRSNVSWAGRHAHLGPRGGRRRPARWVLVEAQPQPATVPPVRRPPAMRPGRPNRLRPRSPARSRHWS